MVDFKELPTECDEFCRDRDCFRVGENKGSFTNGVGYTSYYDKPILVCMTRHLHGCPDGPINNRPIPKQTITETDIEQMKCTKKIKSVLLYQHRLLVELINNQS